jgi:CrcB protein
MADAPVWLVVVAAIVLGALGAMGRWGLTVLSQKVTGHLRWGIVTANVVGSGFAGYLLALDHALGAVVAVGLLGSLTTFSSVAYTMAEELNRRAALPALGLLATHTLLGLPAVALGFLLGSLG